MTELLIILLALAAPTGGLRQDATNLWHRDNTSYAISGATLATIAYAAGDAPRDNLGSFGRFADITDVYGSSAFNLPASLTLWSLGNVTHREGLERLGRDLTRTLALTQLVVAPLKIVTHRKRPDRSNSWSFPSGHTANAFAIARYLHSRYGERLGAPLYVAATATGAGRLEGRHHYLSDVIMGAAIGLIVGSSIERESTADNRFRVTPTVAGHPGLTANLYFL